MTEPPPPPAPDDLPDAAPAPPAGTPPDGSPQTGISRRWILRGAAAAPLAALPACGAPEPGRTPTAAALEFQNALTARPLDAGRLPTILPAVKLNHAFFRPVRAVELTDDLEPAVRFHADSPAAESSEED